MLSSPCSGWSVFSLSLSFCHSFTLSLSSSPALSFLSWVISGFGVLKLYVLVLSEWKYLLEVSPSRTFLSFFFRHSSPSLSIFTSFRSQLSRFYLCLEETGSSSEVRQIWLLLIKQSFNSAILMSGRSCRIIKKCNDDLLRFFLCFF